MSEVASSTELPLAGGKPKRGMTETLVRALTGAGLIVVMVLCFRFGLHGILFSALAWIAVGELLNMSRHNEKLGRKVFQRLWQGVSAVAVLGAWAMIVFGGGMHVGLLVVLILVFGFLVLLERTADGQLLTPRDIGVRALALVYVVGPILTAIGLCYRGFFDAWDTHSDPGSIIMIYNGHEWRAILTLFIFMWTSDTGAYLVGRSIGRRPLAKRISPKKSIEGAVGGIAFAVLAGWLIGQFWFRGIDMPSSGLWMGAAVVASVSGILGDLFESLIKRGFGVKDSGHILPGHGGVLDRFDSFLFAAPAVWLYWSIEAGL